MKAACVALALTLGPLASSRADVAAPPAADDAAAQLQYILDNPLKESAYTDSDRCLFGRTYRSVEILDRRHLLFVGSRDDRWLNQLRMDCVGLRSDSVLIFDMRDHGLCDLDGVRGVPRNASFGGDFVAHCTLGKFERITPAQADQLRMALSKRGTQHDG